MKYFILILIYTALLLPHDRETMEKEISGLTGKAKIEKTVELAEMIYQDDEETAMALVDNAIQFSSSAEEPVILMKSYFTKGDIYYNTGRYREAGEEYKNSLKIAETVSNTEYLFKNCKNLGGVFYYLSDFKTASIFFYKALEIADSLQDEVKQADIYNDLGSIRDEMKDYDKAVEFYNNALEIYSKKNDELEIAKVYNNIAITLNNKKELDSALTMFEKALEIYKKNGKELNQAIILNNMGSIYIDKKNINKAINSLNISEKIFKKNSDTFGLALNEHNFGKAYFDKKDFGKAESYFISSNKRAEEMGVRFLIRDNYLNMAKLDSSRSRFKNAYNNYQKFVKLNEEILKEENKREIEEVTSKYELAQKEKQNFSLIRDNEVKRLELDKQRQINNFFIILFALLIGISYFAYRSYMLKSKNEELLREYSEEIDNFNKKLLDEIEKSKKELNESNDKLVKAEKEAARMDKLASLGTMVAGITHEIKNPTQVIKLSMDTIRLSLNDLAVFIYGLIKLCKSRKGSAEEIKKLIEKHKVKKLFNDIKHLVISNQKSVELIDNVVSSTTKISRFNRETNDNSLNEIIQDVLVIIKNSIKYSAEIKVQESEAPALLKCNYQEMAQILINLLTNARDAIEAKENFTGEGVITIATGVHDESVYIEVSDNGIGMSSEEKDKAFDQFYSTKTNGNGQGLGLYIVKTITDTYGGTIEIDSEAGEGTKFRIIFPINNPNGEEDNEQRD